MLALEKECPRGKAVGGGRRRRKVSEEGKTGAEWWSECVRRRS
jgi:hypothetical protein